MGERTPAEEDNPISDQYRIGAYLYDAIVFVLQLFVGGAPRWRRSFIALIDPLPDDRILELCCGTGSVSLRIARKTRGTVRASDLSSDQIKVAQYKAKLLRRDVEFSTQDASNTTYQSSCFDKVIISGALHEIKKARRQAIYREAKRLLKDNGYLFVSEPDLPERGWGRQCFEFMFGRWNPEHDTAYELVNGGLEAELADAGFQHEKSCTSNLGLFKSSAFKVIKNER